MANKTKSKDIAKEEDKITLKKTRIVLPIRLTKDQNALVSKVRV